MVTRIFVSPPTIQNNEETGRRDPTVVIHKDGQQKVVHGVEILGPSKVVYDPDGREKYGARVFVETKYPVIEINFKA